MSELTLLSVNAVAARVGVSRGTLHRWRKDGKFPRPRNVSGSSVGRWLSTDIDEWMKSRPQSERK